MNDNILLCKLFDRLFYCLIGKLDYIVSDNGANMRKAFTVCFENYIGDDEDQEQPHDQAASTDVDDPTLWSDDRFIPEVAPGFKKAQQCFAHTLQLAIGDAIKTTR